MNEFIPDYASPPGDTLKETMEFFHMSNADLAARIRHPVEVVEGIISGDVAINMVIACHLELVFGIPYSFWVNRERQYREAITPTSTGNDPNTPISSTL